MTPDREVRIERVLAIPAVGAGYYEDLAALQASHVALPERFTARPVTDGFRAVREVAEAVSVGLVWHDPPTSGAETRAGLRRRVAWGDCVTVSYSAKAGREPVFRSELGLVAVRDQVAPLLEGRRLAGFRPLAAEVDALTETVMVTRPVSRSEPEVENPSLRALLSAPVRALQATQQESGPSEQVAVQRPLHSAVRYGASQALLRAVALAHGLTMTQVIANEWGLPLPKAPVPIHAQSGHERYYHAEKMIVRRIASLPHALVDDIPGQVGKGGSEMTRYIRWLKDRIPQLAGADYQPTLHLDLHGALGQLLENRPGPILGQLYAWQVAAEPFRLRIESPVIRESRAAQIEMMKTLRGYVRAREMTVQLVADEWVNTLDDVRAFVAAGAADLIQIKMPSLGSVHNAVEAVLACKAGGVGAFVGGSYAETALSARVAAHVALATQADLVMAKPGMGVDEGISLMQNEMARTLAFLRDEDMRTRTPAGEGQGEGGNTP